MKADEENSCNAVSISVMKGYYTKKKCENFMIEEASNMDSAQK